MFESLFVDLCEGIFGEGNEGWYFFEGFVDIFVFLAKKVKPSQLFFSKAID